MNEKEINEKEINDGIDEDYIKRCLAMTPEQRLMYLEELNEFLDAAMPKENKEIARKLREEGF